MASDERNFRSAYYEKVGFKNVEEKKSIEMLLKDKIDTDKLKQFCIRYCVPAVYRNLVWKILLEVLPGNKACHEFVLEQKKQEYADLLHCAYVIRLINDKTPKSQMFLSLLLIYKQSVRFGLGVEKGNTFTAIVETLTSMEYFCDDTDIFWVATSFFERLSKYDEHIPRLIETTQNLLEKEDPELHKHLFKIEVLNVLPLDRWFQRCYSGVLNENALAKIWDKVVGGANCKILVFVAIAILINLKHRLMRCTSYKSVMDCIQNVPEDTAEIIVSYAIQMWHQHGVVH